jgi:hypothetical protein
MSWPRRQVKFLEVLPDVLEADIGDPSGRRELRLSNFPVAIQFSRCEV